MNENATKARIKSKTGIDCVIAWLEPCAEDDLHRKVKVSAVRIHPPVGSGFWDVTIELDDEKLGSMSIYREGVTYTHKICRALVAAVGGQATHAARNRKNRKARQYAEREARSRAAVMYGVYKDSVFEFGTASLKPECEAVIAETVARQMMGADDEFWDDLATWDWRLSAENNMWRTPDQLLELKATNPEAARILAEKIKRDPALRRPHQLG